jgi:hypothetical protein
VMQRSRLISARFPSSYYANERAAMKGFIWSVTPTKRAPSGRSTCAHQGRVFSWCRGRDLNPYPLNRGLGPQPSASADSATSARARAVARAAKLYGLPCVLSRSASPRLYGRVSRKLSNLADPSAKAYKPNLPDESVSSLAVITSCPLIWTVMLVPFTVVVSRFHVAGV